MKKVCVKHKESGVVRRLPREEAEILVKLGTHHFTTKGSLKRFLKELRKIYYNQSLYSDKKNLKIIKDTKDNKYVRDSRGWRRVTSLCFD